MNWVLVDKLDPPHAVGRPEHVDTLVESLQALGWVGPALVGYPAGDKVQLLTGTHRLAAARHLGWVAVPVEVIPYERVYAAWGDLDLWTEIITAPAPVTL